MFGDLWVAGEFDRSSGLSDRILRDMLTRADRGMASVCKTEVNVLVSACGSFHLHDDLREYLNGR